MVHPRATESSNSELILNTITGQKSKVDDFHFHRDNNNSSYTYLINRFSVGNALEENLQGCIYIINNWAQIAVRDKCHIR